jgi:hypothetical protein
MIYITDTATTSSGPAYAAVCETPSGCVDRKWVEEILPHFHEPASRQRAPDPTIVPAMLADEDVDLDSPPFTPPELNDFAARGYVRRGRWAAPELKR